MLQVPVRPADVREVILHACSTCLQGVIGAETAGKETQTVLQVTHRLATHHRQAIRNEAL